jgi:cytoskeletal protein RodZ
LTVEAQRLRLVRGLLVAVVVSLGLAAAPAAVRAAGPERPPVKAPSRLGPEPAPVARTSASSTTTTSTSSSTTSSVTPSTTSRPVITSTTSAPPQQRPATSARPKPHARPPAPPRATHRVKTAVRALAHTIRPATGLALVAAPAGTSESNRLLFLGGLALLVLVLGDATFLAMSARAIRDQS